MAWFARFDRFGSGHLVRSQDKNFGCGMSSIAMVNFKQKKGLLAAGVAAGTALSVVPGIGAYLGATLAEKALDDAVKTEAEVADAYARLTGANFDLNSAGVSLGGYAAVLGDLGLGKWSEVCVMTDFIKTVVAAAKDAPVIVVVDYAGGGSHALVVDEVHAWDGGHYLCICDPWDGELRLLWAKSDAPPPAYDASVKPVSFTMFGDRRSSAGAGLGTFNPWIVRRG